LINTTIECQDLPAIVQALTQMPSDGFDRLGVEFVEKLIGMIVDNDAAIPSIPEFASQLPVPLLLFFLEKAPLQLYPEILQLRKFPKEEFDLSIARFIDRLLMSYPPLDVVRKICGFKFSRSYSGPIIQRIVFLVIYHSQKVESIGDITLLISCVIQLMINCARELMKSQTLALELVRKLSHTFAKRASAQPPTYKQLRTFAKLYDAVAKTTSSEMFHYLIASFVSHVALVQLDEGRMKAFHGAVIPLFGRCSRKQFAEVSTALHEAQRQIFQYLYARWESEARFTGKV
jgi:hypothetical protein